MNDQKKGILLVGLVILCAVAIFYAIANRPGPGGDGFYKENRKPPPMPGAFDPNARTQQ